MQKKLFYLSILSLAACTFDAGTLPGGPSDKDTQHADTGADSTQTRRDQSQANNETRDTGRTRADASDMGNISDATGSDDMAPDLPSMCQGLPVDVTTDPKNCGACGVQCDDRFGQCAGAQCVCPGNTLACGANNSCTNVQYDPNNCGLCGEACEPGEFCVAGACECRQGFTLCNGECVETDSNPMHCGQCNVDCGQNACRDGVCRQNDQCGFAWTCDQPNNGPACITDRESDLHCNPTLGNQCGTACEADEVCFDPGLFQPPECFKYRPAIICTLCPCNECLPDEFCNESDTIPGEIFCIESS